ncbi:hypothetical protein K439DRAFT_1618266 [Ramaria rubella]|nr:hypothetical protein K439DRAFT_1618266 [Ramaria rubella]
MDLFVSCLKKKRSCKVNIHAHVLTHKEAEEEWRQQVDAKKAEKAVNAKAKEKDQRVQTTTQIHDAIMKMFDALLHTYRHKEPLCAIALPLELPDNGTILKLQLCIKACLEEHPTSRVNHASWSSSSRDPNVTGPSKQADVPALSTSGAALPPPRVFTPLSPTPEAVTVTASHHTSPQVAQPFHPSPSDPMSLHPPLHVYPMYYPTVNTPIGDMQGMGMTHTVHMVSMTTQMLAPPPAP